MSDAQLEAALDLTRRLPPADIEDNLFYLLDLAPDLTDALLSTVDQPLKATPDEKAGRDFLLCDYNRDGDSFRSPWTNSYFPHIDDGAMPSDKLREMEVQANRVFDRYRELYFGQGSISSVYFWDLAEDDESSTGWATCVLMYKESESGVWNSIHVVEVTDQPSGVKLAKGQFQYKLTTTVMVSLSPSAASSENQLSGSLTRQETKSLQNVKDDTMTHIANMGRMIEEMESRLRGLVDVVYFGKTEEVLSMLRELHGTQDAKERAERQKMVVGEMSKAAS